MEAVAMHFDSLGIHGDVNGDNFRDWHGAEAERIRSLVQEFFSAPGPSANCSIKRGDMSVIERGLKEEFFSAPAPSANCVMERWLKELCVGWVLSLEDGISAGEELDRGAQSWTWSWIQALDQIEQTFRLVRPLFPDSDCGSVSLPGINEEQVEPVAEKSVDRYHLVLFIQETMLKLLAFVDLLVAWNLNMTEEYDRRGSDMLPPYGKLFNQLVVNKALSEASYQIPTMFGSPTSVEAQRVVNEMAILLSAYKSKFCEATWGTMEKIRTKLMEDGDDSSSPQGSSEIHKVTQSIIVYIRFLYSNRWSVGAAICDKYVPNENERPIVIMIVEMVSCLQEKLASISESFQDQALKFLFLLNNSNFIQESLVDFNCLQPHMLPVGFSYQIEGHVETYLKVSWSPLLSCLFNPTSLCLGKNYSLLSKFESEFEKIYTAQKLWKVPDPVLRSTLRELIVNKIIPTYKEYIEDNKASNPKISPQELKVKLQELFEG